MKNLKYEMGSLFEGEKKYDIVEISKLAFTNMQMWIDIPSMMHFKNELERFQHQGGSFQESIDLFYNFFDTHIDNFFNLLVKSINIEEEFLQENRDQIIINLIEFYIPSPSRPDEPGQSVFGGRPPEDPEEDPVLAKAMRQSRELTQKPKIKTYAEMSKWEIEKEINDAIDKKDYEKLKKLQPYVRESLKVKIDNILNEGYIMPSLFEGCGCGSTRRPKLFPKILKPRGLKPKTR
jgi:hypothetical protein